MTVIQTGAIAAVAFVFGDYASELLRLGDNSSAIYAALGVVALSALNIAGTRESKTLQKIMQILLFGGLLFIGVAGLLSDTPVQSSATGGSGSFGLAMIFVLLTYGGWNEAAYIAGEVRDARRNMTRILIGGILVVTALYLLVNLGYLSALGISGMKESKAVAADAVRAVVGERAALVVALIVCVAALTTMNAAIFTGARTNFALGRDFGLFARLGAWRERGSTPANALLLQGAIAVLLVWAASFTRDGFTAMVAYTAPVFWVFFYLTAVTLFRFRERGGEAPAFRVPLYPHVPIAFALMCIYMVYSSTQNPELQAGFGTLVISGLAIMAAGIPVYFLARR
jgi:amino acid transporter